MTIQHNIIYSVEFCVVNFIKYLCCIIIHPKRNVMQNISFTDNKIFVALLVFVFLFSSCGNSAEDNKKNHDADKAIAASVLKDTLTKTVKINNKLFGIPSPFLTANRGKKYNAKFHSELLNPVERQKSYFTNFKQAINLGIYGADLSYLTIYNQLTYVEMYVATIKMLSEELGIEKNVDEKTIARIEDNVNNQDSLIYLISEMFKNSDTFLFKSDRNDIGALILSGGWIESLYFITQTIKDNNNQELLNLVGEQKQPLNNLIELLKPYQKQVSTEYDKLMQELSDLAVIFNKIEFSYQYKKSTSDTVKKVTQINTVRECKITNEQLQIITNKIEVMRNVYVK